MVNAEGSERARALAAFQVGQWQLCVDALLAAWAQGAGHPLDAVLLSRCFAELGDRDRAIHWAESSRVFLDRVEGLLSK